MIFTEADNATLYRLTNKMEKNTATLAEMCAIVKLQIKKRAVFKLTGERR